MEVCAQNALLVANQRFPPFLSGCRWSENDENRAEWIEMNRQTSGAVGFGIDGESRHLSSVRMPESRAFAGNAEGADCVFGLRILVCEEIDIRILQGFVDIPDALRTVFRIGFKIF